MSTVEQAVKRTIDPALTAGAAPIGKRACDSADASKVAPTGASGGLRPAPPDLLSQAIIDIADLDGIDPGSVVQLAAKSYKKEGKFPGRIFYLNRIGSREKPNFKISDIQILIGVKLGKAGLGAYGAPKADSVFARVSKIWNAWLLAELQKRAQEVLGSAFNPSDPEDNLREVKKRFKGFWMPNEGGWKEKDKEGNPIFTSGRNDPGMGLQFPDQEQTNVHTGMTETVNAFPIVDRAGKPVDRMTIGSGSNVTINVENPNIWCAKEIKVRNYLRVLIVNEQTAQGGGGASAISSFLQSEGVDATAATSHIESISTTMPPLEDPAQKAEIDAQKQAEHFEAEQALAKEEQDEQSQAINNFV